MFKTKKIIVRLKKPNFKDLSFKIFLRRALLLFVFFMVAGTGVVIGVYKGIMQNLPPLSKLEEFEPKIITYINDGDGEVIGEYATEKRIQVPFEELPDVLLKAIIATEDPRFYQQQG